MTRLYAISAVALVAVMLGGIGYMILTGPGGDDPFAACRTTQVSGGMGSIGGPFTLVNGGGETVTEAEVITEPAILYFGYTFCPDICPFDAARNADAVDLLAGMGVSATPVFISIDPERDTPEVVGDFAANMHPKMIGLTGSPEQVRTASQAYRTYFRKQEGDPDYYLVDHSTFSYLALPDHGVVEVFRRDTTAEEMARAVACFAAAASSN
ncbi:MAG: SCO family protein [Paracoccaceae bacterium]|nr:SCO family protein [Paracoccaceae bacterium]